MKMINCDFCEMRFDRFPSQISIYSDYNFCSRKCYWNWKRRTRVIVKCENCDKIFYIPPSKLKYNFHFCSRKCYRERRITRKVIKCEICGKEKYRPLSKIHNHTFCSKDCYCKWRKGNSIKLKSLNSDVLRTFYWGEKLNLNEIGKKLNCSNRHVLNEMVKFNIPRRNNSESHKLFFEKGGIPFFKGKHLTKKTKKKLSKSRLGIKNPNLSELNKTPEFKKRSGENLRRLWQNEKWVQKLKINAGKRIKKLNQLPEFQKKRLEACHKIPNKEEIFLNSIIQNNFPNEFIFNIPTVFVVDGRAPDWINGNKVILHHGLHWHLWRFQEKNPKLTKKCVEKDDINFYRRHKYNCLIIWEDELKNQDNIIIKIKEFLGDSK